MFTGLVRELGDVVSTDGRKIDIRSRLNPGIGDSIAVNGVCLTVVELRRDGFTVEAADETRRVVPPEKLSGRVHLEPAMMVGERFEGHIVQGHVDCIGEIVSIRRGENAYEFTVSIPTEYMKYIVPKGSVAVDGISLTINGVFSDRFVLTIIPHTVENTLFSSYRVGSRVNIETDLFARYIERILSAKDIVRTPGWSEIDAIQMSF
jgi:riboflavin synthase